MRSAAWALAFVIASAMSSACASSPDPPAHHEAVALEGSPVLPHFLRIYDSTGQLTAEWVADRGPIGWTETPERLIFVGISARGRQLLAGDPSTGVTRILASHPTPQIVVSEAADALIMRTEGAERVVPLPGRLLQAEYPRSSEYESGSLRIEGGEVWRGSKRLLEDRGLAHALLSSPSGKWVAAIETQRYGSRIEYRLGPIGDTPKVIVISDAEPRGETPTPSSLSPSATREAHVEPFQVSLALRGDAGVMWYRPVGGAPDVWWSPDGGRFAFFSWDSRLMVADLDGHIRLAVQGLQPQQFRGWNGDVLVWRVWLVGGHP